MIVLRTWRKRAGGREDVCYAVVDLGGTAISDIHGLAIKKTQAILVGKGSFLHWFVKNAIAPTHNRLVINAVSEPDARSEGLAVDVLRPPVPVSSGSRTKIGVSAKDISGVRVGEFWIDRREPIKGFAGRQIDIVAKAVVKGKFRTELVAILCVQCVIFVSDTAEIAVVQRGGQRRQRVE